MKLFQTYDLYSPLIDHSFSESDFRTRGKNWNGGCETERKHGLWQQGHISACQKLPPQLREATLHSHTGNDILAFNLWSKQNQTAFQTHHHRFVFAIGRTLWWWQGHLNKWRWLWQRRASTLLLPRTDCSTWRTTMATYPWHRTYLTLSPRGDSGSECALHLY